MTDQMTPQPQMTPEQALEYLENQINAEGPVNGHYGPKGVFVMAQIAFIVLRETIKPKATQEPK